MKVWVIKRDLEWLKEMQNEARTRQIDISSFRRFVDDREISNPMDALKAYEELF